MSRWRLPLKAGAAGLALVLAAEPAQVAPSLWRARGAHAEVVLFGSVHLLPRDLEWTPPALADAIARADEIWFELPIDGATDAQAMRLSRARGFFPAGERLEAHLTTTVARRLAVVADKVGLAPSSLDHMRPWLAEIALSLAFDARSGASPANGVEQRIAQIAPSRARRRAFETVRGQIGFLADAPIADQVASLNETVDEITDDPGAYGRLVSEWAAGDLDGLGHDALEPMARVSPNLYRRLITDRNQRWAAILQQRLRGDGVVVVVVGAGHLIGPGGVPALLRARGFVVEGPSGGGQAGAH